MLRETETDARQYIRAILSIRCRSDRERVGGGPTRHFRSRPVWGWGWPRPRLRPLKSCRPPGPRSCQLARYPRTTPAISTASLPVLARRFRADPHEVGRIEGIGLAFFGELVAASTRASTSRSAPDSTSCSANSYEVLGPRRPGRSFTHLGHGHGDDQKMRERHRQTVVKTPIYIPGLEITRRQPALAPVWESACSSRRARARRERLRVLVPSASRPGHNLCSALILWCGMVA